MNTITDFEIKQRKYMPVFPMATGKTTVYIEGYPYEDDDPMPTTGFHNKQVNIFYDQLSKHYADEEIYVGTDSFIYYSEGDTTKCVAPDVYVVLGVSKSEDAERRSFYTWAEGAVPVAAFEFLSESTEDQDRHEKVELYLKEIGIQEYYIHQPEMKKQAEFRGWKRSPSGEIVEMMPDTEGGLFSEKLKLWFRWTEQPNNVRLLRAFKPDGMPIETSMEDRQLKEEALERLNAETLLREIETRRRQAAEKQAEEEAQLRKTAEAEIERLREQLANRQNNND